MGTFQDLKPDHWETAAADGQTRSGMLEEAFRGGSSWGRRMVTRLRLVCSRRGRCWGRNARGAWAALENPRQRSPDGRPRGRCPTLLLETPAAPVPPGALGPEAGGGTVR